jgi:phosphotriesterase-related protein
LRAARLGVWISLDNVNAKRKPGATFGIPWYTDRIVTIKEAGLLNRLLLSHDAGWYSPGEESGGTYRGYTAIFDELIPALQERGITEEEIELILVRNPVEAFSITLQQ